MKEWVGRQLVIAGVFFALLVFIGIGLGSSWATDMWAARSNMADNPQAYCTEADKDCAQKDLPAQVRTADAAEAMVDLSLWQLFLGGLTTVAAVGAAFYARGAFAVSKQALELDARPWLAVTDITMRSPRGDGQRRTFEGEISLHNFGKMPAQVMLSARFVGSSYDGGLPDGYPLGVNSILFMPGETEPCPFFFTYPLTAIIKGRAFIIMDIEVMYCMPGGKFVQSGGREAHLTKRTIVSVAVGGFPEGQNAMSGFDPSLIAGGCSMPCYARIEAVSKMT
ncbi:MAG: hypothetical protein KKG14_03420 [Alphaproteobacteria bacterium]|nr:hypothetical protein [Alphaproteobacteria bacterium]MBU2269919.1 hypothetical protein [Alphaproteobacteria bacterium]MBU2417730.1 hypothetical protein [Alphaproteobacteria bacterium]